MILYCDFYKAIVSQDTGFGNKQTKKINVNSSHLGFPMGLGIQAAMSLLVCD